MATKIAFASSVKKNLLFDSFLLEFASLSKKTSHEYITILYQFKRHQGKVNYSLINNNLHTFNVFVYCICLLRRINIVNNKYITSKINLLQATFYNFSTKHYHLYPY